MTHISDKILFELISEWSPHMENIVLNIRMGKYGDTCRSMNASTLHNEEDTLITS